MAWPYPKSIIFFYILFWNSRDTGPCNALKTVTGNTSYVKKKSEDKAEWNVKRYFNTMNCVSGGMWWFECVCPSQNSYVAVITPSVPLGSRVMRLGSMNAISAFVEEPSETLLTSLPFWKDTATRCWLCTRKWAKQQVSSHCDPGLPGLQNWEKWIPVVSKELSLWYFTLAAGAD